MAELKKLAGIFITYFEEGVLLCTRELLQARRHTSKAHELWR